MKRMQNYPLLGIALVIGLIFIVMPLTLDLFRLNLIGKYLTYAFVAVGLVLCWGYSGILSLGQGIFFNTAIARVNKSRPDSKSMTGRVYVDMN